MRIFRHCGELPSDARGGAVALGNFDGVHRGHQAVILTAQSAARAAGGPCGVMTFEPHPRRVFQPDLPPFRLNDFRVKANLIGALGVDHLFVQTFDKTFSSLEAEDFVKTILVDCLGVRHVVVGHDYSFGKGRKGGIETLRAMGAELGFSATEVAPVVDSQGEAFSSTRVRSALLKGDTQEAAKVLGRYWEVEGRVQHGDKRGRTIDFPTANIGLGDTQRPAKGVYAVLAGVDNGDETVWLNGAANFGERPTVDGKDVSLEVHLLDFEGDLYGKVLRVAFIAYIRPEIKFDGLDALQAQIAKDVEEARAILADARLPEGPKPLIPAVDSVFT